MKIWIRTLALAGLLLAGLSHAEIKEGTDYKLLPKTNKCYEKHGSGCVLSSAITANLALGQTLQMACENA